MRGLTEYSTTVANLVVDIGNTALKAAWSDRMTLGKTFRYQGEKVMDFILSLTEKVKPDIMVVASAKELGPSAIELLKGECGHFILMDSRHTEVARSYDIPSYLTPDRSASVLASKYLFKGKPCTLFDFGTTMTVDFISPEGQYEGGNISIGCRTRFKAVNRYSKALPLLDTPEIIEEKGNSLQSSIQSGIIQGIMFEIEGYLLRYPENIVVFTGGDAIYFAKRMKNSIFVVCNLVLMGLALIADEYGKTL